MKKALLSVYGPKGAFTSQRHHPNPREVNSWLGDTQGRAVWTTLRHPYTQALSWYYHISRVKTYPGGFEEFLQKHDNGWLLSRLNIYEGVVDSKLNYVIYEEGLDAGIKRMGFPNTRVPVIGRSKHKSEQREDRMLTDEAKELIRRRWPADMDLYAKVRETSKGAAKSNERPNASTKKQAGGLG